MKLPKSDHLFIQNYTYKEFCINIDILLYCNLNWKKARNIYS